LIKILGAENLISYNLNKYIQLPIRIVHARSKIFYLPVVGKKKSPTPPEPDPERGIRTTQDLLDRQGGRGLEDPGHQLYAGAHCALEGAALGDVPGARPGGRPFWANTG